MACRYLTLSPTFFESNINHAHHSGKPHPIGNYAMKKFLPALVLFGASALIAAPHVLAQAATPAPAKAAKPPAKKAAAKKAAKKKEAKTEAAGTDDEDKEPDLTNSVSVDYQCELGNKLTIYENAADDKHIALRWNKRLHRLTRVETSTGANRFENRRQGLVWIGIPAKGILLDSKKGQQLANECKNSEQLKQKAVATDAPGILSAPAAPPAPAASTVSPAPPTPTVPPESTVPPVPATPSTPEKPQD
jgi:membrane-bound inhibitor of C-type lysozyme